VGSSTSHSPVDLHGLIKDGFIFFLCVLFIVGTVSFVYVALCAVLFEHGVISYDVCIFVCCVSM
jgi:hypothetical protein